MALLRGDTNMTWRCRINEGYCYVHCRMPTKGKGVICRMLGDVMARLQSERGSKGGLSELTVVRNMCMDTLRFIDQIQEAGCNLLRDNGQRQESSLVKFDEQQHHKTNASVSGGVVKHILATHDDFQRIKIVQDRIWR